MACAVPAQRFYAWVGNIRVFDSIGEDYSGSHRKGVTGDVPRSKASRSSSTA